jgi:pyridinium-3,5-bisthiocarboxylic acid mononucleotide nickel chelatase
MSSTAADRSALWLDPGFGASGDMLLGVLAGLLDDPARSLEPLSGLGLRGCDVRFERVVRGGLSASRAVVTTGESHHHRRWSDIDRMLAESPLSAPVIDGARRTFRALGEVEAIQHDVPIDDVHFHEVGALDAIVDIVGVWLLVEALRQRRAEPAMPVVVGPVGLGHGTVRAAHGILPLPAPATVALLRGRPTRPLDAEMETCTPTGAALLVTLAERWGPLPAGRLGPTARGAGGKDPHGHPNVVTAVLVECEGGPERADWRAESAVVLETNLDDVTPEVLAHAVERLLDLGVADAWIVPIVMKKGRPAHELRVLCDPELADRATALILAETGTLGVRRHVIAKQVAHRQTTTIMLRGHEIGIKQGPHGSKPEHADLVRLSAATGLSVRRLADEARAVVQNG